MQNDGFEKFEKAILKAHREGVKEAIDLSIRTGVPLVVWEDGKIKKIKPKYKYVLVPIKQKKRASQKKRSKLKKAV